MPRSAPKGCRYAGCSTLVVRGSLCDEHKPLVETSDDRRPGSSYRGYDRNWRRLRLWYLRRNPICQWPGCNKPASQVDHVVPISHGGSRTDPANLQSLCHSHHSLKTTLFDGGFGNKPRPFGKDAKAANCATPERVGILDPIDGTRGRKDGP